MLACKSNLKLLDPIHYQALRICICCILQLSTKWFPRRSRWTTTFVMQKEITPLVLKLTIRLLKLPWFSLLTELDILWGLIDRLLQKTWYKRTENGLCDVQSILRECKLPEHLGSNDEFVFSHSCIRISSYWLLPDEWWRYSKMCGLWL